ncbi:UvrD-helicase domain-containing protein [Microbispora amethystogenes]|uniref:UvrD-helicase domain-containing protein n=1 Tax=Microbispora amethystogenes TaxID=1427754 RepID=UPI0033D25546
MAPKPTAEQTVIIDTVKPGDKDVVVEAGAGCGKTTTLKAVARAIPDRKGLYIAYNKAIQVDAEKSFPDNVVCKTAHGLAYGAVGRLYARRLRGGRVKAEDVARLLRINDPLYLPSGIVPPAHIARVVMATVKNFTLSARRNIMHQPVARISGLDDPDTYAALCQVVPKFAAKAWADITDTNGRLPFTHDCYLKMWTLSDPQLTQYDFVMLDEAQDSNPPVAAMVQAQKHAQKILVGDSAQSIYAWRGAEDAMAKFDGVRLTLSQSFRFGPAVAEEANKWLEYLDAPLRLRGFEAINSRLTTLAEPDAILCRTNAKTIGYAMEALNNGRRVAIVGGGDQIRRLAEAAIQLKAGIPCSHPELFAFKTWGELQEYVENEEGSDLAPFVKLIDSFGAEAVLDVVERLVDEDRADLVLSTAHKAKGREWHRVKVADDFPEPKPTDDGKPGKISKADANLAYVTVTRAMLELDNAGLAWIDHYLHV